MAKLTKEDAVINTIVYIVLFIVFVAMVYPFYYCLVISFNEGIDASTGGIFLWPRKFTFVNYKMVLSNEQLIPAFCFCRPHNCRYNTKLAFYGAFCLWLVIQEADVQENIYRDNDLFNVLFGRARAIFYTAQAYKTFKYILGIHNTWFVEPF